MTQSMYWPQGNKTCFMLNLAEHEITTVHTENNASFCSKHSDVVFILETTVKMPIVSFKHL